MTVDDEGVLDASSAINCINSDSFDLILSIPGLTLGIGPIVRGECGDAAVEAAIAAGKLRELDDGLVPAGRFLTLLGRYGLGDGETECLTFAEAQQLIVVTDDGAARKAVTELLGEARLTGSLGLLRRAVKAQRIRPADAIRRYELMKARGAFLPDIDAGFFAE